MSRNTKPLTPAERAARDERESQADASEGASVAPQPDAAQPDEPATAPARRLIRSAHRGQMLDLKALANRIAGLSEGVRRTLPLDDEIQAQFDLLAACHGSDRRRMVMRAKLMLGGLDLVKLEAALAGDTPDAARDRICVRWRAKLIAGDDTVIQQFVEAHPDADRQAIRTSAREARGQGGTAERAFARLLPLLRAAVDATQATCATRSAEWAESTTVHD